MNLVPLIRDETEADYGPIAEVTIAAFNTLPISNHTEQFIITALRRAGALSISLVAELRDPREGASELAAYLGQASADGRIIGHIAFSPVTMSDGTPHWYGLGPVSVLPQHQRQGVGTALIEHGLARLKAIAARGCCLVGHPEYYRRFGFQNTRHLVLEGVPPDVFFVLSFDDRIPTGTVTFHEAFSATA
jgi:putative acetyltransferase